MHFRHLVHNSQSHLRSCGEIFESSFQSSKLEAQTSLFTACGKRGVRVLSLEITLENVNPSGIGYTFQIQIYQYIPDTDLSVHSRYRFISAFQIQIY